MCVSLLHNAQCLLMSACLFAVHCYKCLFSLCICICLYCVMSFYVIIYHTSRHLHVRLLRHCMCKSSFVKYTFKLQCLVRVRVDRQRADTGKEKIGSLSYTIKTPQFAKCSTHVFYGVQPYKNFLLRSIYSSYPSPLHSQVQTRNLNMVGVRFYGDAGHNNFLNRGIKWFSKIENNLLKLIKK